MTELKPPAGVTVDFLTPFRDIFTFSPFGLSCLQCKLNVTIQMNERSIQLHLKKHCMDGRVAIARALLKEYKAQLDRAKAMQTIEPFRIDNNI